MDNECFGKPIEWYKVRGEGSCGAPWNDRTIGKEKEGATCEEVRAHADTKFSFGLGICGGLV